MLSSWIVLKVKHGTIVLDRYGYIIMIMHKHERRNQIAVHSWPKKCHRYRLVSRHTVTTKYFKMHFYFYNHFFNCLFKVLSKMF